MTVPRPTSDSRYPTSTGGGRTDFPQPVCGRMIDANSNPNAPCLKNELCMSGLRCCRVSFEAKQLTSLDRIGKRETGGKGDNGENISTGIRDGPFEQEFPINMRENQR